MTAQDRQLPFEPRDEGSTIMTDRIARRFLGLATGLAMIVAAVPAGAADMGGIKDYGGAGGVPVPAPVPIAEYDAEWYIGIAAGGVLSDSAAVTSVGGGAGMVPVHEDMDKVLFGGISAGRYITNSLRMEVAVEAYDDVELAGPVETYTTSTKSAPSEITDGTFDTNHYDVTRTDKVTLNRTLAMLNVFYDLDTGTRLRPYIGGGIGVSWRQLKRRWTETAECVRTSNNVSDYPDSPCLVNTTELPSEYDESGSDTTERFDLALAAMAGLSYEIAPGIVWDNGYQLLWEAAGIDIAAETVSGVNTVAYKDALQHHFRSGLRFNID